MRVCGIMALPRSCYLDDLLLMANSLSFLPFVALFRLDHPAYFVDQMHVGLVGRNILLGRREEMFRPNSV